MRFLRDESGQGLVEMALVLPILLLLFMGIFELGHILGSYMVINNLAREGARYGVVGHDDSQIEAMISSQCAWLDESNLEVTVTPTENQREKGDSLKVEVDYSVPLVSPFISDILPNPVPISARCYMRVER